MRRALVLAHRWVALLAGLLASLLRGLPGLTGRVMVRQAQLVGDLPQPSFGGPNQLRSP
jgi:hypothetical protein